MNNFAVIAWIDTFELAGSLRQRVGRFGAGEPRVLPIRGPRAAADDPDDDLAFVAYKDAAWPELKSALGRLRRMGDAAGGFEFGRVYLEMLMPGTTLPWEIDESAYGMRFSRLHVALRTNPGAMVYSGTEAMHLLPGQATIVSQRAPHCAINLGETPRIHLIVDFRRKDGADD